MGHERHEISEERRIGSLWGLKRIYYVMAGLAMTSAVLRVKPTFETTCMLILFMSVAVRYVHGAAAHFGEHKPPERPFSRYRHYQPILDFIAFLVQAMLLIGMSRHIDRPAAFFVVLLALVAWDSIWIAATLIWGRAARHDTVAHSALEQWLRSNAILFIAVLLCSLGLQIESYAEYRIELIAALTLVSVVLFVWDYHANTEYYFGERRDRKSS